MTWTASRLLKSVLGDATIEVWRDPSGAVLMLHVTPHEGWIGHPVSQFQTATGGRVALLTSARHNGFLGTGDAVFGRLSGMRMFSRSEVVERLRDLGFEGVTQRVNGLAQFVGGRLPD